MNSILAVTVVFLVVEANAQWWKFPGQAALGAYDMGRAYLDMRKADTIDADKYFHARGNYDAARRGPGGYWAAKVISDAREKMPAIRRPSPEVRSQIGINPFRRASSYVRYDPEDSAADQRANEWGRNGGDPNTYRPPGLDPKYK